MNLPVEIVELVINQFLKASEDNKDSYITALNAVSLISSFYLELSRRFKFKDMQISGNKVYFGQSKERSRIQGQLPEPVTCRTGSTFHLAQYAKHLSLFPSEDTCNSFIRIFGNHTLNLESIEILCDLFIPLDLQFLSKLKLERFPRLDRIKFFRIPISSFNQYAEVVTRLNPDIKLELDCHFGRSLPPPIQPPLYTLRVTLCRGFTLSCFEPCLQSLRKLDLYIDDVNCDSFISSATNLKELTIRRSKFVRASYIATIRVACKLKDIRKVSISHYLCGSVDFFFKDHIVIGIDAELRVFCSHPLTCDFSVLVRDLVNESSYIAKTDVIKEITGQESDVDIRCFFDGAYIKREACAKTLVTFR